MFFEEIAIGSFSNRGIVIPTSSLKEKIDIAIANKQELYNSYYFFDEEILEHFKIRKTVKNYKGKYHLDNPLIDIDRGTNTDDFTLVRIRELLTRLEDDFSIDLDSVGIFFSGTGYHIVLPNIFKFEPSNFLPDAVRDTMLKYFPEGDNIYDGARLIRTVNTINNKSGLYKIPLTAEEARTLSASQILELAKEPRYITVDDKTFIIPDLSHIVEYKPDSAPDHTDATNIVTCVQKMYLEGAKPGTRHKKMLRMLSAWRRQGIPKVAAYDAMVSWASNMQPYEVKHIVDDIYSKAYVYSCKDTLMTEYCDPKCIFYKNRNFAIEVITAEEAEKAFVHFVRSDIETKAFDLNEIYNCNSFKFYPGEVCAIIGDTKLGKSTIVQNIITFLPRMKSIYLSLENYQNLAYRRFIQIAHNMTKGEVIEHYKVHENSLRHAIEHITMLTLPPTIEDIRRLLLERKPEIVIIDTLDGISTPGIVDITQKTDYIANSLKVIAGQTDTIIICIAHISKAYAIDSDGKQKPMTIHSAKGSTFIAQKFDKVLAWEGTRDSKQRVLSTLGTRDEGTIRIAFEFNTDTFRMEQIARKLK